jgi:Bax protein
MIASNAIRLTSRILVTSTAAVVFSAALAAQPIRETPEGDAVVSHGVQLANLFAARDYHLDSVREGWSVPQVFLARLPEDLEDLNSPEERKHLFIRALLPHVLRVNEEILIARDNLLALKERRRAGDPLTWFEVSWLQRLGKRYGVPTGHLDSLIRRVDVIPPSLAIAQAALESGWGAAGAMRRANALFGHMIPDEEGEPRLRRFDRLGSAVEAYMLNLNAHPAYEEFRRARSAQRRNGESPDGHRLAGALLRYSERRGEYVRDLRALIRANDLSGLDVARLSGSGSRG